MTLSPVNVAMYSCPIFIDWIANLQSTGDRQRLDIHSKKFITTIMIAIVIIMRCPI